MINILKFVLYLQTRVWNEYFPGVHHLSFRVYTHARQTFVSSDRYQGPCEAEAVSGGQVLLHRHPLGVGDLDGIDFDFLRR